MKPLRQPPIWQYTAGAGWHSLTGLPTSTLQLPPAAYELGFEDGAYALAEALLGQLQRGGVVAVTATLLAYERRLARPTLNWRYEKSRS